MTVDSKSQERGNKESMLPTFSTPAKFLLNSALYLNCSSANHGAAVGDSGTVSIDQIRLISTLRLLLLLCM
jgi:hypothetical protein